jgi:hypothetical protein
MVIAAALEHEGKCKGEPYSGLYEWSNEMKMKMHGQV